MIDIELLPLIFVILVALFFLFIALYFNFINREYVYEDVIIDRILEKPDKGHVKNISIYLDSDGRVTSRMASDFVYISGDETLPSDFKDKCLIELNGDNIYTLKLPKNVTNESSINIWNSSSTAKNIRCHNKIVVDGIEKKIILTLKPGKIVTMTIKDSCVWYSTKPVDFIDKNKHFSI